MINIIDPKTEYEKTPIGIVVSAPRFSWIIVSAERSQIQTAYQILVSQTEENLNSDVGDMWDSGKIPSNQTYNINYKGLPLKSGSCYYWKTRAWDRDGHASEWSSITWWQMGLTDPTEWRGKWIGPSGDNNLNPKDSPLFRTEFRIDNEIKQAIAYAYGLGWYELYLNGSKAGERLLSPANSIYGRINYYDVYDVTKLLEKGENAVGIWLGNGYGRNFNRFGWKWENSQRAILQIKIEYKDGSSTVIVTDENWRASGSPIISNDVYHGETYDARLEKPGWCKCGYDDSGWEPVGIANPPGGKLVPNLMHPIKIVDYIKPVSITHIEPDINVIDFGQNFAGWVRLSASGAAGDVINIRYSELIGEDGMLDTWTNYGAQSADAYILKGEGCECYEPRFAYHGFQFAEIKCADGILDFESVIGCVIHSDVKTIGAFSTSNQMLNRIHRNILWGITNNLMSIPTDCCSRDERTPCLMDSCVVEDTAIYNFDMHSFYAKWLDDLQVLKDSAYPDWGGDQVVLPWRLYYYYGDVNILENNYDNMKRFIDSLSPKANDYIISEEFGDWCAPNDNIWGSKSLFREKEIVNTSLYYYLTNIVAETAEIIGKPEDARRYKELALRIKEAFNNIFLNKDRYGNGSQTAHILPLALGLVPEEKRPDIAAYLVEEIMQKKGGHLDTGIFGTRYLLEVLADNGYVDVAYAVLNQTSYPGFGYQIEMGATTTWEQWYSKGIMSSHNHAMFGGIDASFYSRLAGIMPIAAGFESIRILPYVPDGLEHVNASTDTVRGKIASSWRKEGPWLYLEVEIPANATALIYVPAENESSVFFSDNIADCSEDISCQKIDNGYAIFSVGSGRYAFKSKYAYCLKRG